MVRSDVLTSVEGAGSRSRGCKACLLDEATLVQLDAILASEPSDWPELLFEGAEPPPGSLPKAWRQWGAVRMAQLWLTERGIDLRRTTLMTHFDRHLPMRIVDDTARLIERGRLSDGRPLPEKPASLQAATDYMAYFRKALALGMRSMELLSERIEKDVAEGRQPPATLLLQVAGLGRSLAQSQASIIARGLRFVMEDDAAAMEGFMEADELRPSPRFGSYRVREIDGEHRAVKDEGRADRLHHNERAREEGSTILPG